jgi:hypothetical protein
MTADERAAYNCRFEFEADSLTAAWIDAIETRLRLRDEVADRDAWVSRINRHLPQGEWLDESELAPVAGEEVPL